MNNHRFYLITFEAKLFEFYRILIETHFQQSVSNDVKFQKNCSLIKKKNLFLFQCKEYILQLNINNV